MGYYTKFEISVQPGELARNVLEAIDRFAGYTLTGGDTQYFECKWYSHEKDVAAASAEYPGARITVSGEGEETGDQWVMYATLGQVVKHKREEWSPPEPPWRQPE